MVPGAGSGEQRVRVVVLHEESELFLVCAASQPRSHTLIRSCGSSRCVFNMGSCQRTNHGRRWWQVDALVGFARVLASRLGSGGGGGARHLNRVVPEEYLLARYGGDLRRMMRGGRGVWAVVTK